MAHNPHIDELGPAVGEHYVGKSNASGIQEYRQMNTDYFLHGADIKNKIMAFSNNEETTNYAFGATPVNLPANPALNATLTEIFDDYFVYWRYNGATWDKLTEESRLIFYQASISLIAGSMAVTNFVIPTAHVGYRCIEVCAFNNSGTPVVSTPVLFKNGVPFGPTLTIPAFSGVCANFAAGVFVSLLDVISVDPAIAVAIPSIFTVTVTLQRP